MSGFSYELISEHLTPTFQDRLLQLTDAVGAILEYFQELERATRMLNHPGDSLVLQGDFLDMVERVDICIDFLKHHVGSVSPSLIAPVNVFSIFSVTSKKQRFTSYDSDNALRVR